MMVDKILDFVAITLVVISFVFISLIPNGALWKTFLVSGLSIEVVANILWLSKIQKLNRSILKILVMGIYLLTSGMILLIILIIMR